MINTAMTGHSGIARSIQINLVTLSLSRNLRFNWMVRHRVTRM